MIESLVGVRDAAGLFIKHGDVECHGDGLDEDWFRAHPGGGDSSVAVSGPLARFHSRQHGDPSRLHSLLLDTLGKKVAAERFAPAHLFCGHFFAKDADGALSEAGHYGIDLDGRFLLEVIVSELPDVLDLTNEQVLRRVVAAVTDVSEDFLSRPFSQSLAVVLDQSSGGNRLTDAIGSQAFRNGYKGVRFFGARAIDDEQLRYALGQGSWAMWLEDECGLFEDLRARPDLVNVVSFSGSDLVRYITDFRIDGGAWQENALFGLSTTEIEHVYQREALPFSAVGNPENWIQTDSGPAFVQVRHRRLPPRG